MNIERNSLIRIAVIAALYAVTSALVQIFLKNDLKILLAVTVIVPVISGILFGKQASIGIFIGGAAAAAIIKIDLVYGAVFALVSAASSMCAYKCFISLKRDGDNEYIHDSRSLMSFIITSILISIIYYYVIVLLTLESEVTFSNSYLLTKFDVIWTSLVIGTLIMLFISSNIRRPVIQHSVHNERWRYLFFIPLIISGITALMYDILHPDNIGAISFSTLSLLLFAIFGPTKKIVFDGNEFVSMKYKVFALLLRTSLILSIVLIVTADLIIISNDVPDQLYYRLYGYRSFFVILVFVFFTAGSFYVEKKITKPVYDLTNTVRNDTDTDSNELGILGDRLDFVSKNKSTIDGNDYILFIGLTKRDGSEQFDPAYAKGIVDSICLRYVSGYISSKEMVGGYNGQECAVSENVISYRILGANDDMIRNILDDVISELCQESILVIKNGTSKWYYYGDGN